MTSTGDEPRTTTAGGDAGSGGGPRRHVARHQPAPVPGRCAGRGCHPPAGRLGPPGCGPRPPRPPADLPAGLFAWRRAGRPAPRRRGAVDPAGAGAARGRGMPDVDVPVRWEVATDERFRHQVRRGTAVVARPGALGPRRRRPPAPGHLVPLPVHRRRPGQPRGRTRTAPPAATERPPAPAVASCQNWQQGFWPLWAHAPADDPDVVLHLGDYIYEGGVSSSGVRRHNSGEVRTLDAYRNRYGLYKGDPALQGIHAACPWVVTWDDHETENNYADLCPRTRPGRGLRRPPGRRLPGVVGAPACAWRRPPAPT